MGNDVNGDTQSKGWAKQASKSGLLIALLILLCTSASCQEARGDTVWSYPHYDDGCSALMRGLHEEWSGADGEGVIEVARKMFWALLLNPNAFYEEFASDTTGYNRFSTDLDKLVFWNPNDTTTAHLQNLKAAAIDRLIQQSVAVGAEYTVLHEELLQSVRDSKITFVD